MTTKATPNGAAPPQDVHAERSVLAAMFLGSDAIGRAVALADASIFYRTAHQKIFDAIVALHGRGERADAITVTDELRRRGELEVVGGPATLAHIHEYATTTANLEEHIRIVAGAAQRRRLVTLAQDIQRRAADPTQDLDSIAHDLRTAAEGLNNGSGPRGVTITPFSEVSPGSVDWLWPGRIPAGMLTVLDGDPGLGKSTATLAIAARLSRGHAMPDGAPGPAPAGTVVLSAEDDLARVIRPRLDAAGADVARIATLRVRDEEGLRAPVISATDLAAVEQAVHAIGARLVIVDPLVAYLPSDVNAQRDQDVRRALAGLRDLAERTGAAVLVVRHLNKTGAGNPLYRGGGSIGIIGAARAGLLLAADPDDPTGEARVLACTKMNLAPRPPALRLRLVAEGGAHPHVVWDGESQHTATSLLAVPVDAGERTVLDEACDYLRTAMASGEAPVAELRRDAPCSLRTLESAKARIGAKARRADGRWLWYLPPPITVLRPYGLDTTPSDLTDRKEAKAARPQCGLTGKAATPQDRKTAGDGPLADFVADGEAPLAPDEQAIADELRRGGMA